MGVKDRGRAGKGAYREFIGGGCEGRDHQYSKLTLALGFNEKKVAPLKGDDGYLVLSWAPQSLRQAGGPGLDPVLSPCSLAGPKIFNGPKLPKTRL